MLKKLLHKYLFLLPLLGLVLTYANGINTVTIKIEQKLSKVTTNKAFYHKTEKTNSVSEYFFEESELEDDIEWNWFDQRHNTKPYTSSVTENQKLTNKTSFCLLQKSTPLYDLFCNWKLHLS